MRNHRHIGAYAIIKRDSEILLIKKGRGAYINKLDLPGGGIEHGETSDDALVREVYEEVGAKVKEYNLIDVVSNNVIWLDNDGKENLHHIGILYNVKIYDEENIKKDADGQDSLGSNWYKIDELKKEDLTPFVCEALNKKIIYNNLSNEKLRLN